MDHDQRFRTLLCEFFREFFLLFFPEWSARLNFTQVEWLKQELFSDPPAGKRRSVDIVAKLPVLQPVTFYGEQIVESTIALVHVEVEGRESSLSLPPRLFRYHEGLEEKYQLPVLPIALFPKVGKDGIGWDRHEKCFWEHCLVQFNYPYIGLPSLNAEEYLEKDNWLGIALTALMRIPPEKRLKIGTQAWRRLVNCPENEYRRYLLCECVSAYLPVDDVPKARV